MLSNCQWLRPLLAGLRANAFMQYNHPMPEAAAHDELRVRGQGVKDQGSSGRTNYASKEVLLRLLASGMSPRQAAYELKRDKITIDRWMRSEGFMERLKVLSAEAFSAIDAELSAMASTTVQRISQASDLALDKVLQLMEEAESEVVQLKAAQDVLDRNPETSKTKKIERREAVVHIDAKFLQLASEAEKEIVIDGQ